MTIKEVVKLDFSKITNFCSSNDTIKKRNRQATDKKNMFGKTYL